jgi:hypothetical protein
MQAQEGPGTAVGGAEKMRYRRVGGNGQAVICGQRKKWHSSNGACHGIKRVLVCKQLSKDLKERACYRKNKACKEKWECNTCYERKAKLFEDKAFERNDSDLPDPKERPSGLKTALGKKLALKYRIRKLSRAVQRQGLETKMASKELIQRMSKLSERQRLERK